MRCSGARALKGPVKGSSQVPTAYNGIQWARRAAEEGRAGSCWEALRNASNKGKGGRAIGMVARRLIYG
jgi:hypothetical protein